ncbi:hypothetical protein [Brevundimonas sp. TWP2-3-2]|uniref:hypothetical protein n=1 Tax=Brevundimonas sp. TWP2-3-2 TaxID=2804648 RepID=UPI003CF54C45
MTRNPRIDRTMEEIRAINPRYHELLDLYKTILRSLPEGPKSLPKDDRLFRISYDQIAYCQNVLKTDWYELATAVYGELKDRGLEHLIYTSPYGGIDHVPD